VKSNAVPAPAGDHHDQFFDQLSRREDQRFGPVMRIAYSQSFGHLIGCALRDALFPK
jgi:hypothetical protein